jgi:hypothetical protein
MKIGVEQSLFVLIQQPIEGALEIVVAEVFCGEKHREAFLSSFHRQVYYMIRIVV